MKVGRKHEMLEVLSAGRRRYARLNFLTAYAGGNHQNRRVEVMELRKAGLLTLHPPNGNGLQERGYSEKFHRIYERAAKHEQHAEQFWHQVLIDDILISVEMACKRHGLSFTDREAILHGRPLELPCSISRKFEDGKTHHSNQPVKPDAIFAIKDTFFVLEADRGTEPVQRNNLKETSYLKKILQYRDVLKNKTYQHEWGIPNIVVLNITTKPDRVQHLLELVQALNLTSRSLCFAAYPSLASTLKSPQPLLTILTDAMQRVGHPPFIIANEVLNGRETDAHPGADNAQGGDRRRA